MEFRTSYFGNKEGEESYMKNPTTYSEWMNCFDIAKEGTRDAEVLECVQKGVLVLSAGVAGRFATQLSDVVKFRIKKASDKFSRAMQICGGDLNLLSTALLSLRKEFKFLIKFVQLPVLPQNDIDILIKAIKEQADQMQKSLEETGSKNDRTGTLGSIIKRNRVNSLED